MPCTLRRPERFRAHRDERLGPGRTAAPDDDRLVLLPSGPDTVRGSPLRGTRSSTSHRRAAFESGDLGRGFSPAGADCRYRAPLVPRLARPPKDSRGRPAPAPRRPGSSVWSRGTSARRDGYRWQGGGEHRSERTCRCVSEEAQPTTTPAVASAAGGCGGEGGIRTRDGLPRTAFPVRRHSPLGDLSPDTSEPAGWSRPVPVHECWRRGRDSNPRCFRTPLFESGTINHSDTSPPERIPNGCLATGRATPLSRSRRPRKGPRPLLVGCR